MKRTHGVRTRTIAEQLKLKLNLDLKRYSGIGVFYDHGDSSKPDVCRPTTYMGRRYGADASLSFVDIVVTKKQKVFIGIEIEESTNSPKTVIGDVFGIALANGICIQGKPYSIKNATIIVAVVIKGKGKQLEKFKRLEHLFDRYFKTNPSKSVKKVRIIPCTRNDLVRRIERLIRLEIGNFA